MNGPEVGGENAAPTATAHVETLLTGQAFSCHGFDDLNTEQAVFEVAWRGGDRYAVLNWRHACLSRDGEWHREPQPSSRDDEWLAEHRFDYSEAVERAMACARFAVTP